MSKEQIKELAEDNAIYEFNKFKKIYGDCADEYVRHFYNKLAELRGGIADNHTCNCRHNSNSRDNEPCCTCDSRQTNADRIRNMLDEELANIIFNDSCIAIMKLEECPHANDHRADMHNVCKECIFEWLQSEAEESTATENENFGVRR